MAPAELNEQRSDEIDYWAGKQDEKLQPGREATLLYYKEADRLSLKLLKNGIINDLIIRTKFKLEFQSFLFRWLPIGFYFS